MNEAMNNDRVEVIIGEMKRYVENLEVFYGDKLGIDYSSVIKESADPEVNIKLVKSSNDLKENKSVKEVDLFGNEKIIREEWEFAESIQELEEKIKDCRKCELWKTRTNFVFGVGNPKADIVVIGEAPGADEDLKGEPFVGRAGQLLNKILEATGFKREDVFICNILKSRPPGNRNPLPAEVDVCKPYLDKQLKLIDPKLILLLGKVASESLLKTKEPLNKLRGKTHDYKGWKVRVTFHPAALLRNPNWKRPTWEDMQQFKEIYEDILAKNS
ncbi:MAG: uracil-DNA glycosylase family protein [Ignavibacteria bacterium]